MGNIAKNINQSASVALGLALSMMPAEVEAAKTNIHNEAHTAEIELASDMIVGNAHDKVLNVVDSQNPAKSTKSREKLETETEPTPAEKAQAKELVDILFELADYKAMDEYLAKNGDNLSKIVLNEALKVAEEKQVLAGKNANYKRKREAHYQMVVETGDPDYQEALDNATKWKEEYKAEVSHLTDVITRFENLLEKKSIPTAEDFAEKPSTIDQKSPAIVKWEKKYEMEIVLGTGEDEGYIDVYHNGEIVSTVLTPISYTGKPILNLTKDGKMVFTYADNEKDDNIIIYIPENGGMTKKSESGTRQLYKFTKTTLAQN